MKTMPLLLMLAVAGIAAPASAADPAPTATAPAAANAAGGANADKKEDTGLVTNVVGSQEAPTVMNVVPWKDKEVKLDKKSPTTSILNQVLQPLDRDVLKREVQYFRSLQEQKTP